MTTPSMTSEPLPCPFCGEKPEVHIAGHRAVLANPGSRSVECVNSDCPLYGDRFAWDAWNSRRGQEAAVPTPDLEALILDYGYWAIKFGASKDIDPSNESAYEASKNAALRRLFDALKIESASRESLSPSVDELKKNTQDAVQKFFESGAGATTDETDGQGEVEDILRALCGEAMVAIKHLRKRPGVEEGEEELAYRLQQAWRGEDPTGEGFEPGQSSGTAPSQDTTRIVVVDHTTGGAGRVFDRQNVAVELSRQDDGRTLKVFVNDRSTSPTTPPLCP